MVCFKQYLLLIVTAEFAIIQLLFCFCLLYGYCLHSANSNFDNTEWQWLWRLFVHLIAVLSIMIPSFVLGGIPRIYSPCAFRVSIRCGPNS